MKKKFHTLSWWSTLVLCTCLHQVALAQIPTYPEFRSSATHYPIRELPVATAEIGEITVNQVSDGQWAVTCDVRILAGKARLGLQVEALITPKAQADERTFKNSAAFELKLVEGLQTVVAEIERPSSYVDEYQPTSGALVRRSKEAKSNWVLVRVVELAGGSLWPLRVIATRSVEKAITWPSQRIWETDRAIMKSGIAPVVDRAVNLIDQGNLDDAKLMLERVLHKDAKQPAAYIEMARVAMKGNWGPEGLLQAERYIDSALQIDPKNTNAFILRGYVYTHLGRFKVAEADFREAEKADPRNLWLWANWGQLLDKQGKPEAAVARYLQAVAKPVTNDTYDRARLDAYSNLIRLYDRSKDITSVGEMHLRRARDYGMETCYGAELALFKLQRQGDAAGAIELVKNNTQLECEDIGAKEILGTAYYVDWAKSVKPNDTELLNRARVYFPIGARVFLRLSQSNLTIAAAKRLIATGESVDQMDNRRMTALAYALEHHDIESTRRLVQLGASTSLNVGQGELPVALLPVLSNDLEAVKLLRQLGVDYSKLIYRGITAHEYARQTGNQKLLETLNQKALKT